VSRTSAILQRGVSLIEAIVALGVMAFGMLAIVGVQATLRGNADVSKQRTEATRLAQQGLEAARSFIGLAADSTNGAVVEYDEILVGTSTSPAIQGLNATYTRTLTVPNAQLYNNLKTVTSKVSWLDRAGTPQEVSLNSTIAGIQPELAASLLLPQQSGELIKPVGRHASMPAGAKSLGTTGTSVFLPPGQVTDSVVAWVFNNVTGLVTGICSLASGTTLASVTAADVADCSTNTSAQLLSGFVRFALPAQLTADPLAEALSPTDTSLNLDVVLTLTSIGHPAPGSVCFDDSSSDAAVAATQITASYFCLIYTNNLRTWGGRSRIRPLGFADGPPWMIAGSGASNRKVCRYTPLSSDNGTKNSEHPLDYAPAGSKRYANLTNQNFLIVPAESACPPNTLLHQDGSSTYNNPI